MLNLFEYQNVEKLPDGFIDLEVFLDDIWQNRTKIDTSYYHTPKVFESQKFVELLYKTKEIKSNKYVGIINFEGQRINLLPKIFYDPAKEYKRHDILAMQHHILWWLSYCRKIKFPNYKTNLGYKDSDFFEVLIYLFAKYTRTLLSNAIYQQYEEVSNELVHIKGRLNTNTYIRENLATAKWHKVHCTYDEFVMDNKFNRIVKFVTKLLFNNTTNFDNKRSLREILFILDEVEDVPATAAECASIKFNPMFEAFETVRDYCHLFLSNYISFDYKNDLKLFAFLLPMEYVFEDFVFGFIDKEIEEVKAKSQISSTHLDAQKIFALKPDLYLKIADRSLIADTKYKIVYSDENDPKKGISQNDLYQMLAYAVRFKVEEILLFYPNTINTYQHDFSELKIVDEFADDTTITVSAHQLPIINFELFNSDLDHSKIIDDLFERTKIDLSKKISTILSKSIDLDRLD